MLHHQTPGCKALTATAVVSAVCLIIAGLLCAVSTEGTRIFTLFAAGYLVVAGLFLMIILPLLAPTHQSTAWVFITFNTSAAEDRGLSNTGCGLCNPCDHCCAVVEQGSHSIAPAIEENCDFLTCSLLVAGTSSSWECC